MACLKSFLLAFVVLVSVSCATARRLQQAATVAAAVEQPPQLAQQAPILIGDGTERILTRSAIRRRGGALKALGRPALQRLRSNARYQGTVLDLAQTIEKDDDLAVDAVNQALLFVCEGLTANASEISSGVAPSQLDSTLQSQALALSSRPESSFKIYLDFDGHTTTGTAWNTAMGRDQIVTPPYDKDSNPASFSPDELSDIVAIWRSVAEDYAMFDVDVTTADPGEAVFNSSRGIRVAVGGSYTDWYGRPAGGVAYVGSFRWTSQEPCFVFPQNLGPMWWPFVAQALSHEVGHTLGLMHDGTASAAYYQGQGDWAPIMGSSYYKPISTFDKGEFAGATNKQDDIAVIGQILPLLPQKFGNDAATATPLTATVDATTGLATAKAAGVVATAAGDWFSFNAAAGPATVSAAVVAPYAGNNRANLDVQLTIQSAATGSVVAVLNPASLDVPATVVSLPADGRYIVAVQGVGSGDPATTGYSSYGSKGQYELTVVSSPFVEPIPSPSPSPAPASSPEPLPSPSPEPLPSPSPEPLPSPSPAPLAAMRVASISMTRAWANAARTQVYCTLNLIMRDASGAPLAGARVVGGWDLTTTAGTSNTATPWTLSAATGSVSFRSSNLPIAAGTSCRFNVQAAELAGYQLNTATSIMTRALTW